MNSKKSFRLFSSWRGYGRCLQAIFFLFCVMAFMPVSQASASFINFSTTLSSKVEGNDLNVSITSTNKGDESAFNVQAELIAGGQKIATPKMAELRVGETYKTENKFKLTVNKKGLYPLILIMHYTDANQYPFSALSCQTYDLGNKSVPSLIVQLKSAQMSKKGNIKLAMKNSGDTSIKAKTWLVVPGELTVLEKEKEISLSSKSDKEVSFAVRNFSALAGSTYQVFAVTEFDTGDEHQTVISTGTIQVVAKREILGMNYIIVISFVILLIIIFLVVQFKRK
jgi:hypothetical protein